MSLFEVRMLGKEPVIYVRGFGPCVSVRADDESGGLFIEATPIDYPLYFGQTLGEPIASGTYEAMQAALRLLQS